MAEDVRLYVLAEFDPRTEERLSNYRDMMIAAGYVGTQTVGINNHLTLGSFPMDREAELRARVAEMADQPEVPVTFEGTGTFGDRVLFFAPEQDEALRALHEAFDDGESWVPHATMYLTEEGGVKRAKEYLDGVFQPFSGRVTRVSLYVFFPSRFLQAACLRDTEQSRGKCT